MSVWLHSGFSRFPWVLQVPLGVRRLIDDSKLPVGVSVRVDPMM